MNLVIIESPYAGRVNLNVAYARACVRDSLLRGEAPFASHLIYTQWGILDDTIKEQRERGIRAGLAWGEVAHATAVYVDLGISHGMLRGIEAAVASKRPIFYRRLQEFKHLGPVSPGPVLEGCAVELSRDPIPTT